MRRAFLIALLPLLTLGTACREGDTIIVNSDCGLVRSDLLGVWDVTVPAASSSMFNCPAPFNGKAVVFSPTATFSFNDISVFASASNVGFFFHDSSSPQTLFGNVETDSCNVLLSFRTTASAGDPTPIYLQCIGTLDRARGTMRASCDSVTVLQSPLTDPPVVLDDCDLSTILKVDVSIH